MNTTPLQIFELPTSFDTYLRHGWRLVQIPHGTKGPRTMGWNLKENCLTDSSKVEPGHGVGLAHAYSGTMALDIDNWEATKQLLSELGIDIDALYAASDAVTILSGKPGRGKLLYAMPMGIPLASKRVGNSKGEVAYELRCASVNGSTVQDVLPPSIHPETNRPYQWGGSGKWQKLPVIPSALLVHWRELLDSDKVKSISTGTTDCSWDEVKSALNVVSSECAREEWLSIGMALHWAGSQSDNLPEAFHLFNEWSAQAETKYKGLKDVEATWRSFKSDNGITLGTLFHLAGRSGWKRSAPDISELFTAVEPVEPEIVTDTLSVPPPEIDLSLWPEILATRAKELSATVGCDPIVPLFAGLGAVCAAIDARCRLELLPEWKVPPILWLMTIGDPGDKKTPGSKPMMSVLRELESEDIPRYKKELIYWEGADAMYQSSKKAYLQAASDPLALLGKTKFDQTDMPSLAPEAPAPPVQLKLTVTDVTSQKLARLAADRPRGMMCYLDEMNSWIHKLADKTSGEDRSCWVESFEAGVYDMERVGSGSVRVENFAISVYGNIQPKVLANNIGNLSADGLLQRFVPGVLRHRYTRKPEPRQRNETNWDAWERLVRQLYAMQPSQYRLSKEAYDLFRDFQDWYEDAKKNQRLMQVSDTFMTAFSKLEGTLGRLAFINHLITSPYVPEVSAQTMSNAIEIIKGYVIPAFRYAWDELSEKAGAQFERWLKDHIIHLAGDVETVSLREIKRSSRRQLESMSVNQQHTLIMDAMAYLEQVSWVKLIQEDKRSTVWGINAQLAKQFKEYRDGVIKAKQQLYDEFRNTVIKSGKYTERRLARGYDPAMMD